MVWGHILADTASYSVCGVPVMIFQLLTVVTMESGPVIESMEQNADLQHEALLGACNVAGTAMCGRT
jgi:hypothetical protein